MRFRHGLVRLVPILVLVAGCQQPASEAPTQTEGASTQAAQTLEERGEILVTVGGCHDCHSPKIFAGPLPEPDPARLLSGHPANEPLPEIPAGLLGPEGWGALTNNHLTAWVGPWGVSFAMNLTSDTATGLGSWTEEMFVSALRSGKHQGEGRQILPPMPWQYYTQLPEEDLKALFAYLRTLPPVSNAVPEPIAPEELAQ